MLYSLLVINFGACLYMYSVECMTRAAGESSERLRVLPHMVLFEYITGSTSTVVQALLEGRSAYRYYQ